MATVIELPQMTDTMTEATLVAWLKSEGDTVAAGEAIAEFETDKAIQELEAPAAGTLLRQFAGPGAVVATGAPVAVIGLPGESIPDVVARSSDVTPGLPESKTPAISDSTDKPAESKPGRVKSSPLARKLATEAGMDIRAIGGTGPGGRVVRRDIENAKTEPSVSGAGEMFIPFDRMRRTMIARLIETHRTIPTFTVTRRIDMDKAAAFREDLKRTRAFADGIGWTEILVKAAALAMRVVPGLNARYEEDGIRRLREVNVGIAVGLESGVIVPVIHRCEEKGLHAIAGEFRDLTSRARDRSLLAVDIGNSTFTVTNLGMYGVDEFAAIINAPDAAILAVGAVTQQAVVREGTLAIARVMNATLTVDHRVADGVTAARWLEAFSEVLEHPVGLIID